MPGPEYARLRLLISRNAIPAWRWDGRATGATTSYLHAGRGRIETMLRQIAI